MIPWTVAHQALLSVKFSRQEYWSGLPFPSPGNLSDLGIEHGSPAFQAEFLPCELPRKWLVNYAGTHAWFVFSSNMVPGSSIHAYGIG